MLFIGEESQQKGQTEIQWNPELPLSVALPVGSFWGFFFSQPTPRELTVLLEKLLLVHIQLDVHEQEFFSCHNMLPR